MTDSENLTIKRTCEGFNPLAYEPRSARATKAGKLLKLLNSKRGATIEQMQKATGWQAHSVRGFLSGTVKKKLGLSLVSETGKDGRNRYRIENGTAGE